MNRTSTTLLAELISRAMGPMVSLVLFLVLVVYQSNLSSLRALSWLLILLIITAGLPFAYFVAGRKRGKISDFDITDSSERGPVYLVAIGSWFLALFLVYRFDLPLLVQAALTAGVVNGLVFLGLTQRTKLSVHSGFWTVLSLLMWTLFGPVYLWLLVGLVPIYWSRLTLKRHTLPQLLLGSMIAGSVLLVVFGWFDLMAVRSYSGSLW